ncbi:Hypothetical protein A7982_04451 [Minicystis rosea]|nr:Hypothetical protein A7982_04451 [Minicystis rosea]
MRASRHEHALLLEQRLDVQPRPLRGDPQVKIDLGRRQITERQERIDAHHPQVGERHLPPHRRAEPRGPHDLPRIRDGERERARAARRLVRRVEQRVLELPHGTGEPRRELDGARRGHDPPPLPREERIAEQLAQPGERVAHRGGRHVETLGGARHVALREHGVEHQHQVQVDG